MHLFGDGITIPYPGCFLLRSRSGISSPARHYVKAARPWERCIPASSVGHGLPERRGGEPRGGGRNYRIHQDVLRCAPVANILLTGSSVREACEDMPCLSHSVRSLMCNLLLRFRNLGLMPTTSRRESFPCSYASHSGQTSGLSLNGYHDVIRLRAGRDLAAWRCYR